MWMSVLAVEQVVAIAEGGVLVERIADGEHHVGLEERLPGAGMAAVAEHADRQRMVFLDDALAVEGGEQRNLEALDETARICGPAPLRIAPNPTRATTFLSLAKASARSRRPRRPAPDRAAPALHGKPQIAIIAHLDAAMRQILGHVDMHRAGTAFEGEVHRLFEHIDRVVDVGQQPALLGGRREHGL